jgi:hypothetical protein
VQRLRIALQRAFRLPAAYDPVRWDHFGDRGWLLVLPGDVVTGGPGYSARNIGPSP